MLTERGATGTDFERGLVLLEIACGQDDPASCTLLARIYVNGSQGKKFHARAHELAARACARRWGPGCTQLGEIIGGEEDQKEGADLAAFRQGCELGDGRGCELYGLAS